MKKRRLFALLTAVLLVCALFSACAQEENAPDDGQVNTADPSEGDGGERATDEENEETSEGDPAETDMLTIEWLGRETAQWPHPMDEAKDFETWKQMVNLMNDTYHLDVNWSVVYEDAYLNTINGLIAAQDVPDSFWSQGLIDDDSFNQLVAMGLLAALDDVLEYSDGSSKEYYNNEDELLFLKAWATGPDGNWYHVRQGNCTGEAIDFSNAKYDLRATGQIHGAYSMNIRQDWLDKLGLSMPTTTDEFFEVITRFQNEDVNANGAADERIVVGLGSEFQTQGVGQWFGLPWQDFYEDPATGEMEVACLCDGYEAFVTYMNKIYAANLVAMEGKHPWSTYAPLVGGNYVSAIHMMPDYIWNASTGDDNSLYQPMPVIQALENVEPRVLIQESLAANNGYSFSSACDYKAAAALLDFLNCKEFYMIYEYGIEGVAWDWNEDGESIVTYALDESQDGYASARVQFLNGNGLPAAGLGNLHAVNAVVYDDIQSALDDGQPYKELFLDQAEWQEKFGLDEDAKLPSHQMLEYMLDFGVDNYHPAAYYSFTTLPTDEEAEISSMYKTDLMTYLMEMTTNLITGSASIDTIDEQIQFAYDNLGLQEYYNVMQARVNRYLVAMGRDAVEIVE